MSSLKTPTDTLHDIEMVIFDKDGTLIDIDHYWCSMIKLRAKKICSLLLKKNEAQALYSLLVANMGVDLTTSKIKQTGPVGIKPRNFIIDIAHETTLFFNDKITREKISDIFLKIDEASQSQLKNFIVPLQGVSTLLRELRQAGIIMALATTDITSRAVLAMKFLKLDHYFRLIVGADQVENTKPGPDLVDFIKEKVGISSKRIVVIGDSTPDLEMASNSGCHFLGVQTGLHTPHFLKNSQCLISTLSDLKVSS